MGRDDSQIAVDEQRDQLIPKKNSDGKLVTITKPPEAARLKALVGARALSCAMVIAYHFFSDFRDGDFPDWPLLTPTISHSYGAVVFFFQLSGFVNAFTSERRRADYSSTKFRNVFWQRRLARLIPSFAFANLFFFPILVAGWSKINVAPFQSFAGKGFGCIATVFAVQSWYPLDPLWRLWNYPSWAVSTEIAFYFLFPFLMPLVMSVTRTEARVFVCCGFIFLITLCEYLLWEVYEDSLEAFGISAGAASDVAYTNPVIRLGEFISGLALGCLFYHQRGASAGGSGDPPRIGMVADISTVIMMILYAGTDEDIDIPVFVAMISPITAVWVYAMAFDKGYVAQFLQMPILQTMGSWSYCTYIHQASVMFYTLWAMNDHDLGEIYNMVLAKALGELRPGSPILPIWTLPMILAICHALGWATVVLVEEPALKWLTRR